jgi:pimeloyl-ACP methyl ester carboxylesterase
MEESLLPYYTNSDLEVLAGSGHYPNYEVPVALASALDRFMSPSAD